MTDLFNLPETLSPRLAWMKRHGVITDHMPEMRSPWHAYLLDVRLSGKHAGGMTEDEAITNLAKLLNIPLWNEEGFGK